MATTGTSTDSSRHSEYQPGDLKRRIHRDAEVRRRQIAVDIEQFMAMGGAPRFYPPLQVGPEQPRTRKQFLAEQKRRDGYVREAALSRNGLVYTTGQAAA